MKAAPYLSGSPEERAAAQAIGWDFCDCWFVRPLRPGEESLALFPDGVLGFVNNGRVFARDAFCAAKVDAGQSITLPEWRNAA